MPGHRGAAVAVDEESNRVADFHGARFYLNFMHPEITNALLRVEDLDGQTVFAGDCATVTLLATAFGVERGLVGDQEALVAFGQAFDLGIRVGQSQDSALGRERVVAEEFGGWNVFADVEP